MGVAKVAEWAVGLVGETAVQKVAELAVGLVDWRVAASVKNLVAMMAFELVVKTVFQSVDGLVSCWAD